ncbi:chloroplast protein FOR GROWTH AND FERTILITY 2-like [Mercurialis annua]|uniref:chloroplast protein FOR GROWTH AND FERTILITY 2-like n=1 Tax=Mercurialis annua TaxID=3986 RepID=UPI00215E86CD|nr:chloroplast protein FOR GROWTH AND FERTILITY 2-like [Mercurialis annua]
MERLLHSPSSSPALKFNLKPTTTTSSFLLRLNRIDSSKLGFPPLTRPDSRRFNSVFCCRYDNSSATRSVKVPSLSPLHPIGSSPTSRLEPKQIENGTSLQQKAASLGTFVVLSAVIMFLIHPVFASPAFATFQTAAKAGGPAVGVGAKLMRTELLSSAWTGFLAGCLHTLSGPDHLAALAPLSIGRSRMESAAVGALWGCGHDAGQLIFGLLFLLLKDRLHIEVIRTWGTRVVGFTLLVIGALGIKEVSEVPTPCVVLENGECDVSSVYGTLENPTVGKKKIGFATFATGIVHGLQPDALMMVLPALALPSRLAGAAFLVMFLVGTVVAMGSYTVFLGSCSEALKDRIPRITEKLTWISSLIAIALGLAIIVSQFFGFSLY